MIDIQGLLTNTVEGIRSVIVTLKSIIFGLSTEFNILVLLGVSVGLGFLFVRYLERSKLRMYAIIVSSVLIFLLLMFA